MLTQEQLYAALPSWLQNVAISLYGLRWRNERLGGRFDAYVHEFRQRDRWSTATFRSWLDGTLRNRLLRAWDTVPYYRRVWSGARLTRTDLARFTRSRIA